jgi:putative ABC transport system permease protein
MDTIWHDIRYGFRVLARKPGFTVVAILTLALGIGANSAIFSVVDAVLLRPLPFREPGQLVQVWMTEDAPGNFPLTGADYLDWQAQNHTFEQMSVYTFQESFNASGSGEPERVSAVEIQANYFATLGVQPLMGRGFLAGEDQTGRNRVALLSYGFWQRHFGGQANVLNNSLELNGEPYQVVGVMPAWFRIPGGADLWFPIDASLKNLGPRGEHHLRALGRVKTGVSVAQARADLLALSQRLEQQFPDSNRKVNAIVVPLKEQIIGNSSSQIWLMFGAVALVLLIACANVANLLLARATDRRREVAVRAAMGAERGRLVRQLLTESVLLSTMGAIPGVTLAYYCVYFLNASHRIPFPQPNPVTVNPIVLLFTLGVSVVIGLLFGLAPAIQTSHINLSEELKSGGKMAATVTTRSRVLRNALVVTEVALSLALLASAGLLLRTFSNLRDVKVGTNTERVLAASVLLPAKGYASPDQQRNFYRLLVERLANSPGVRAAAASTELPLEGGNNGYIQIEGQIDKSMAGPLVEWTSITPDYFQTMEVPLLAGRGFTEADLESTAEAARKLRALPDDAKPDIHFELITVISETMARRFWPNQDPIGKVFRRGGSIPCRVIGVAGDTKIFGLRQPPIPQAYFPLPWALGIRPWPIAVVAQSAGQAEELANTVRTAVKSLDATLAVFQVRTMQQITANAMSGESDQTALLGTFAGLAMLLAAVGIYGVMSYLVTQRRGEIGIRMALGAGRGDVIWMVLRQGLTLAAAGIVLGLAGALATTRLLGSLLFGVKPNDPVTLLMVSALMAGIAILACVIPAFRAMQVNPVIALRYE